MSTLTDHRMISLILPLVALFKVTPTYYSLDTRKVPRNKNELIGQLLWCHILSFPESLTTTNRNHSDIFHWFTSSLQFSSKLVHTKPFLIPLSNQSIMGPTVFPLQCTCNVCSQFSPKALSLTTTRIIRGAASAKPLWPPVSVPKLLTPVSKLKTSHIRRCGWAITLCSLPRAWRLGKSCMESWTRIRKLGKNVMEKFGGVLPFLPKILSIKKALELQIHPNKDLAAKLHAKDPE